MESSIVLGFFDGVHLAHRAVIRSAVEYSKTHETEPILVTLKDSPALYFGGEKEYIYKRENLEETAGELGIKRVIFLNFEKIVSLTPEEFLMFLKNNYNPKSISTGFNHTFGINKTGNAQTLRDNQEKFDYEYLCIPEQIYNGKVVSSTAIKQYLKAGNIQEANSMLDGNFYIDGTVIHGNKIGRTIGFPTANIKYPEGIVKIPYGVYKTEIKTEGKTFCGMMNWGIKPTIGNNSEPIAEVHILDFNNDLYGKNLKIIITNKIRGEMKFSGIEELKNQIEKDIDLCLKL